MNELHQHITYSFLSAGHTKFAPDRSFGIIEKVYKVNFISSIYKLARVIEESSSMGVNKAQLVRTHDGRVIVPTCNWASFVGRYFNKLSNIKKYHTFVLQGMNLVEFTTKRTALLLKNHSCC